MSMTYSNNKVKSKSMIMSDGYVLVYEKSNLFVNKERFYERFYNLF